MRKRKKNYVKDGFSIEIIVDRDINYKDLLSSGCDALDCSPLPFGHTTALFTPGGAMIKESKDWSLSLYMHQHHRGPGKLQFGIGFVSTVSLIRFCIGPPSHFDLCT